MVRLLHGVPMVAVDTPSGVDVDTGELDGDHVVADADRHVRHPQGRAPRRPGRGRVRRGAPGRHRARPAGRRPSRRCRSRTSRPCCRGRRGTRTSTPAGSSGSGPDRREYPGAGLLSVAGAASGLAGMVRYVGDDAVAAMVREAHPEVVGAGRVQAWVVGSGSGEGAKGTLDEALGRRGAGRGRRRRPPAPRPTRCRSRPCSPRTPASSPRCSATERDEVEARPLHHVRAAAERYDAVVLLKGRRTLVAAARTAGSAPTRPAPPWLATAGAGDVLGGLVGALLAAGLAPYDAASVGAWLHGAAATLADPGRRRRSAGRRRTWRTPSPRRSVPCSPAPECEDRRDDGTSANPRARRDRRRRGGDPAQRAHAPRARGPGVR